MRHNREPPAARTDEASQLGEERLDLRLVTDGIAADKRRSRHDAIGEEGAPGPREEVALVAAQREEGKAVAAVGVDQARMKPPLPNRLRDRVPERLSQK